MTTCTFRYLSSLWGWLAIALALLLSLNGCATRKATDTITTDDIAVMDNSTGVAIRSIPMPLRESAVTNPDIGSTGTLRYSYFGEHACTLSMAVFDPSDERSRLCNMNANRAAVGLPPLDRLPPYSR